MEASSSSRTLDLSPTGTQTQVITTDQVPEVDAPTLRINLRRTSADKKVSWNSNTVDNENMGKRKSKCCCIYKKPLEFGESSSEEDDDECDHCFGHVEKKKQNQKGPNPDDNSNEPDRDDQNSQHVNDASEK